MGMGWLAYDTQFRLRLASNPAASSFAVIDQELCLLRKGPPALGNLNVDRKDMCKASLLLLSFMFKL